jgi:hypothetical protein
MKLAMKNRPSRLAVVASFAALLIAATGTPTAAQQAAGSGATAQASRELPPTPSATFGLRLMQWSSTADRGALMLFAGLSAPAATASTAQQAAAAEASAAQAGSPSAPLAGPRLRPEVPSILERSATPSPAPPPPNTTIVISTLALVLIAVIVTILIVK